MKEIMTEEAYWEEFENHRRKQAQASASKGTQSQSPSNGGGQPQPSSGGGTIDEIDRKLCEIALETRKFEIDLYWKRTTYYWAFSAAIIAAYALVYTKKDPGVGSYTLLSVLALCGVVFSLGWYLANRGSKYWQENWEDHIAQQITRHYGPIFKILKHPKRQKRLWGIGGFPFSVSKINQLTSGFLFFVWIILLIVSLCKVGGSDFKCFIKHPVIIWCAIAITALIVIGIFLWRSQSKHYKDYLDYKKGITKGKKDSPMFYTYD